MELKIGILLPRSDMYPTLALDFLKGLKLAVSNDNTNKIIPKYVVESIGTASTDDLVKSIEKIILQEDIDITISFCGFHLVERVVKIFDNYKKPLIRVDLGGNVIQKDQISPYVIHHSLNLCESAYVSGLHAIKNFGKKAVMLSSAYDGGYQLTSCFDKGFTENGGEYNFVHVSPMDYKSDTLEPLLDRIKSENPDFILSNFSHKEGNRILEAFGNASFNGDIPILASPIMTDETFVTENYGVKNIHSIASWSFEDEAPEMQQFVSLYSESYDQPPNVFSLLGFECGQLIIKNISNDKITAKIGETMVSESLQTPRGTLLYNHYHQSLPEKFQVREFQFNKTQYHNRVVKTLDATIGNNLNEKFEDQMMSGWQNPYICT